MPKALRLRGGNILKFLVFFVIVYAVLFLIRSNIPEKYNSLVARTGTWSVNFLSGDNPTFTITRIEERYYHGFIKVSAFNLQRGRVLPHATEFDYPAGGTIYNLLFFVALCAALFITKRSRFFPVGLIIGATVIFVFHLIDLTLAARMYYYQFVARRLSLAAIYQFSTLSRDITEAAFNFNNILLYGFLPFALWLLLFRKEIASTFFISSIPR